jgi:hypothetical protein
MGGQVCPGLFCWTVPVPLPLPYGTDDWAGAFSAPNVAASKSPSFAVLAGRLRQRPGTIPQAQPLPRPTYSGFYLVISVHVYFKAI